MINGLILPIFGVVCIASQSMCGQTGGNAKGIISDLAEGEAIVLALETEVSKGAALPTSINSLGVVVTDWVYIRLDNNSYLLSKKQKRSGARIEYRYGIKHHGPDFVGWYLLEGEKSMKLKGSGSSGP